MSDFDQIIFKEKSFSNIIEDIYSSKQKRSERIELLSEKIEQMVTNAAEAVMIIPVLKECFEVEIDNDDLLVKTAAIVQRSISNSKVIGNSDETGGIVLSEKELLELEEVRNKMLESSIPKQIEKKCSDAIDEISTSLYINKKTDETNNELESQDLFDQLKREIDTLMESHIDTSNNKSKATE